MNSLPILPQRSIGCTGLRVTEVAFGASSIGNLHRPVLPEEAGAVLEAAWSAGIRFFDKAPHYGHGLPERRLGDFLRTKPAGDWVLATKVGRLLAPMPPADVPHYGFVDPLPFHPIFDYSYDGVMRSIEQSFARLGLSRLDIAWVHDIGMLTHGEADAAHREALFGGGLHALERLKASGAIRAYGLGVNEVDVCLDVMERAPIDAILLAGRYTLLDRTAVQKLIPLCRERQTSLVIGGVFNSGILATGPHAEALFDYRPASDAVRARVECLARVAARHNLPLAAAALHFPLSEPVVASVVIGTAKAATLRRNLEFLDLSIPSAVWSESKPHTLTGLLM